MRIYADYNANVPMRDAAKRAMVAALDLYGNPSSIHQDGQKLRMLIENARRNIKSALGVNSHEVIFTSGATEAAQLAIESAYELGFENIFLFSQEHDAIFQYAQTKWKNARIIPSLNNGQIDYAWLEGQLEDIEKPLLIIQAANNETGVIFPLAKISGLARQNGGALLVDATQAFGKVASHEFAGFADWLVVSSHKIGGPMGAGALVLAPGIDGFRGRVGGGQEKGLRAGTQNAPAIIGMGAAAKEIHDNGDELAQVTKIRDIFETELKKSFANVEIIGENTKRLGNTSCFIIPEWSSEFLVIALDLGGVSLSSGSACSSGSVKVSRVIKAIGLEEGRARCVVRVSFGHMSTETDAMEIVAKLLENYNIMVSKAA